ncbi:hypothetical protein SAMN05216272_1159 [Pseudomonas panipatensis]|uniref:Uncharacterized protein n=2 Tax=Pseudomonas panipatensis TaxID=428992 RepID=A0A1G8MF28_9PSED|nr:hypothetical protein SAMN05216272_1159 [Pseudomonas panipatensis]SMP76901.1 hypothetical protein SAMN06295951_1168 [Pseudomonas panipatensis]
MANSFTSGQQWSAGLQAQGLRCAALVLGVCLSHGVRADMLALDDDQLAEVQGAGIGFVVDNAMVDGSKATTTITGLTDPSGKSVSIAVRNLYLGATGSNKGATLAPVTIGRLAYPFKLNLYKGSVLTTQLSDGRTVSTLPSDADVLELAFPPLISGSAGQPCISGYAGAGSGCSSRASEKLDLGARFDFTLPSGTTTRTDVLNLNFQELAMDGSYLRFWGSSARSQLVGELRLNLYAKTLDIMSCAAGTTNCSSAAEMAARSVYLTNAYASVALGYGKSQPLLFSVASDGNFNLELPALTSANAADFYANAPRTSLVIDNLNFGGTRPSYGVAPADGSGVNLGRSELSGLSFNYLKVTSHSL